MAEAVIAHFKKGKNISEMKAGALKRSKDFTADSIIGKLLKDTGLV